jgi:hypothetical protein
VREDEDYVYFVFGRGKDEEEVAVPPLSFYALKKCWPQITEAAMTSDTIIRVGCVLDCIEAALGDTDHPRTAEELSKKLTAKGWLHLTAAYSRLLVKSGLLPESALIPQAEGGGEADGSADPNGVGGTGGEAGQASSTSSSDAETLSYSSPEPSQPILAVNGPTSIQ